MTQVTTFKSFEEFKTLSFDKKYSVYGGKKYYSVWINKSGIYACVDNLSSNDMKDVEFIYRSLYSKYLNYIQLPSEFSVNGITLRVDGGDTFIGEYANKIRVDMYNNHICEYSQKIWYLMAFCKQAA